MSARRSIWILVFVAIVALFLATDLVELLVDWLWFDALGYVQVFRTIVLAQVGIGLVSGVFAFAFLYFNVALALNRMGDPTRFLPQEVAASPVGRWLGDRGLHRLGLIVTAVIGLITGLAMGANWHPLMLFFNGGSFGESDPIFQRDAGFYVFTMPFLEQVQTLLWAVVLLSLIAVGLLYLLKVQAGMDQPFQSNVRVLMVRGFERGERLHVAVLGGLLFVVIAAGLYLDRFGEMYRPGGLFTGPGYADIYGTLPVLALKTAVMLISAALLAYGLLAQRNRWLVGIAVLLAVVWIGGNLYSSMLQRLVVSPNELDRERAYLGHHIEATNRAYALDRVQQRRLDAEQELTEADIEENAATVNNIRLWDHQPLLDTFSQIQEIRTYYDFTSVDNDRYMLDGRLRQTMLSPRELQKANLPSRTWINERLVFTHGYGITMGPVNEVNEQGLPVLFIQDIPPVSTVIELGINRPEIYFGEMLGDYAFVNTDQQEFDYPKGDQNVFSTYEGSGGVSIGSLGRRLLMAAYLQEVRVLLADDFNEGTRVMLFRNVMERVHRVLPFLNFDRDPYMVVHDGRLKWIVDAYTQSSRYPYSQRISGVGNYMRNPVKVVVDAYDGSITVYRVDEADPIAAAYARIFPDLFQPMSAMPAGIKAHLRHPTDYFSVQAHMYTTYHMRDADTFYNKEDQWEVPVVGQNRMEPYYTVMKLPGEEEAEFILMLPFTPRGKDNLAAWMAARMDGEHYGELIVYQFPKQKLVYGPGQIAARINQDPTVSQQITLWDRAGSNVIRGTLLVIPIESSLVYIQPLYLRADEGRIPELKRVIVGYRNQIAMGVDLEGALDQIFRGEAPPPEVQAAQQLSPQAAGAQAQPQRQAQPPQPRPQAGTTGDLPAEARQAYEAMQEASRQGDWNRFGQEMQRLGEVLRQLEQGAAQ